MTRVLVIDNHDSYTHNLVQLLAVLTGEEPFVVANDERPWGEVARERFDCIVVSPGPGTPARAADLGISADAIRESELPLLGVCLGHQAIAYLNGGQVAEAPRIVHGGKSQIEHAGDGLFATIPSGFGAVRYHSLVVSELPPALEATAWTSDGVLMALRHRERPQWGVQFHPESIQTEHGERLLANFLRLAGGSVPVPRTVTVPRPERRARGTVTGDSHRRLRLFTRELEYLEAESLYRARYAFAPDAFWLDSARAEPGLARFSFLGAPSRTLRHRVGRDAPVLDRLAAELGALAVDPGDVPFPFHGGFVGYLGYETKAELGVPGPHRSPYPDAAFGFVDRFFVVDHEQRTVHAVALDDDRARARAWLAAQEPAPSEREPLATAHVGPFAADLDDDEYLRAIDACHDAMRRGDSYEICLTTQLRARGHVDPLALYEAVRATNPAPYGAFLRFGDLAVLCSSPERFLRVDADGLAETKPIKGTAPRADDPRRDRALAEALRTSPKTVAENLMITDVLRNDLGRIAEPGTVEVPTFLGVESYATVHQLVSTIRARLRPDATAVDALRAMFPGGSMTGAPRRRTMEIIDRLEPRARGVYAGALGYLSLSGTADFNVVIRTLVVRRDELALGVGGAITIDSDPHAELAEAKLKAEPLLRAVERYASSASSAASSASRSSSETGDPDHAPTPAHAATR